MNKYGILILVFSAILISVNAESVTLISTSNQTTTYNIVLNKTTIGIYQFLLANASGTPYIIPTYQNCTITNVVNCTATFLHQGGGLFNQIEVYKNGVIYENLSLSPSQEIFIYHPAGKPSMVTQIASNYKNIALYVVLSIIAVLVVGNVVYYIYKTRG